MRVYNKHTITNGSISYEIQQVGEYFYRIKNLTRNQFLRQANNHAPKTLFTFNQLQSFMCAMRCWIVEA